MESYGYCIGPVAFSRSFVLLYHDLADVSNAPVENFREGQRACPPFYILHRIWIWTWIWIWIWIWRVIWLHLADIGCVWPYLADICCIRLYFPYPKARYKSFPWGKLARLGEPDEGRGAA